MPSEIVEYCASSFIISALRDVNMFGRTIPLFLLASALAVVLVATCTAADVAVSFTGPVGEAGNLTAVSLPDASATDGEGVHAAVGTAANFASSPSLMLFTTSVAPKTEMKADSQIGSRVVTVQMRNASAASASRFVLIGGDVYFIRTNMTAPQIGFVAPNETSSVPVYAGLGRGEYRFYRDQVATNRDRVVVDLDWGDPSLDPTLTVYPPDGALGTYHDGDDGRVDGRIYLEIAGSERLTPGEWYYRVTGDGARDLGPYSFTII